MTTAPEAEVAIALTSACAEIDGAVVSCTVTLKLLVASFPAASVALQFTVVVPRAKVLPEAGVQTTATLPSTMSLAVGLV